MEESLSEAWRILSQSVFEEMEGWRNAHPTATLREIEEELDARLSGMRARMLADLAQKSSKREWSEQETETRPQCPHCGTVLQARGKHERKLLTQGDQEIKLTRQYGTCPQCGSGLFPPGR